MSEEPQKPSIITGEWFAVGVALGVAFGIIFDNLGLWLPIGVCVGAGRACMEKDKEKQ